MKTLFQLSCFFFFTLRLCPALVQPRSPISTKSYSSSTGSFSEYATYWENLLLEEYHETAAELRDKRKSWSPSRLESSGLAILNACAEPDSEILGEKIVRIIKRSPNKSKASSLRDKFKKGDVLVLTPMVAIADPIPRECLVTDVGEDWLLVGVGPTWPKGLYEARKQAGYYRVRVERAAPQAPLRSQRKALEKLRKGQAGSAANLLVKLFYNQTKDAQNLASQLPRHLTMDDGHSEDDIIKSAIQQGLQDAMNITSFNPNNSQQDAISWALQRTISLIRGPPGTGKTRTAALLISTALRMQKHMKSDNDEATRVLAVTHSNGAADVLLEALLQMGVPAVRLGRPAAVSPSVQHRTIVALTEKMPQVIQLRQEAADLSLDKHIRSNAAFQIKQCTQDIQSFLMESAPVVVTSCIGAQQLFSSSSSSKNKFPIVVLDEAAQTTEPALLCPLAAAQADQLILVGDTKQLPPTITSMKLRKSLGVSPMARLESNGVDETTLSVQYRMSPGLLEYPSKYFYNGLVVCSENADKANDQPPLGFPWRRNQPLAFVQVGNGNSEVAHNFGGKSNPTEAKLAAQIVFNMLTSGEVKDTDIAVISPYSKQVQLIRTELDCFFLTALSKGKKQNMGNVRVGTVDSFQGQEKEVIIFSSVRSNPLRELGFLRDSRRLCVAITRAKRGLILLGDASTLRSCRHWSSLLDSCEQRDCIFEEETLQKTFISDTSDPSTQLDNKQKGLIEFQDKVGDNLGTDNYYGLF